jgi:hypothetical protein
MNSVMASRVIGYVHVNRHYFSVPILKEKNNKKTRDEVGSKKTTQTRVMQLNVQFVSNGDAICPSGGWKVNRTHPTNATDTALYLCSASNGQPPRIIFDPVVTPPVPYHVASQTMGPAQMQTQSSTSSAQSAPLELRFSTWGAPCAVTYTLSSIAPGGPAFTGVPIPPNSSGNTPLHLLPGQWMLTVQTVPGCATTTPGFFGSRPQTAYVSASRTSEVFVPGIVTVDVTNDANIHISQSAVMSNILQTETKGPGPGPAVAPVVTSASSPVSLLLPPGCTRCPSDSRVLWCPNETINLEYRNQGGANGALISTAPVAPYDDSFPQPNVLTADTGAAIGWFRQGANGC